METNIAQLELITKMILTAWDGQNSHFIKLTDSLTDAQLSKEIAPGKNTGIYLMGHLIAVSDAMLPLLKFGEKLFPDLEKVFIRNPDNSGLVKPSIAELKNYRQAVNAKLNEHIRSTTSAQWLERHTSITPEDFVKEPHRNKLNIIISRTHHMAYHLGQMVLLS